MAFVPFVETDQPTMAAFNDKFRQIETIANAAQSTADSKQNKLTFDSAPTENSTNPVTSGGIFTALAATSAFELLGEVNLTSNSSALFDVSGISPEDYKCFVIEGKFVASSSSGVITATDVGLQPMYNGSRVSGVSSEDTNYPYITLFDYYAQNASPFNIFAILVFGNSFKKGSVLSLVTSCSTSATLNYLGKVATGSYGTTATVNQITLCGAINHLGAGSGTNLRFYGVK